MNELKVVFWLSEIREETGNTRRYGRLYYEHAVSCIRGLQDVGIPVRDIIIFLTPANVVVSRAGFVKDDCVNGVHVRHLRDMGVDVRLRKNILPKYECPYSNKLHVCDVESPNVLFLDLDCCIWKDPRDLLDGEFDFAGKKSDFTTPPAWNWDKWNAAFKMLKIQKVTSLMTAACMLFKDYAHQKIRETWWYYQERHLKADLPLPYGFGCFGSDQHTLTWAVAKHFPDSIRWLTGNEFAIGDQTETPYMGHGCWNYRPDHLGHPADHSTSWEIPDPIKIE